MCYVHHGSPKKHWFIFLFFLTLWNNESTHKVFIQINSIIFRFCIWFFFHAISFMDSRDLIISYHAKCEDMAISIPIDYIYVHKYSCSHYLLNTYNLGN
jgi:hypothetical protein